MDEKLKKKIIRIGIALVLFESEAKLYYDIKLSLTIGFSKTMKYFGNSDYDTTIIIEQEKEKEITNCFKISKWPEIIIAPFAFFKVEKVQVSVL